MVGTAQRGSAFALRDWGLDTVDLGFTDADLIPALTAVRERGTVRHPATGDPLAVTTYASGSWSAQLDYAVVMGYPTHGLVKVNARAVALTTGDPSAGGLVDPLVGLPKVEECARSLASKLLDGQVIDGRAAVHRLDFSTDLTCSPAVVGRELMMALTHLRLPRLTTTPHVAKEVAEGVSWATATTGVKMRVYDKGLERLQKGKAGDDPAEPGSWLRFERQLRFPKKSRQTVPDFLATVDLPAAFLGAFGSMMEAYEGAQVVGLGAATKEILERRNAGDLTERKAAALLGHLTGSQHADSEWWINDRRQGDVTRDLRRLGLIFERGLPPYVSVDIGAALRVAASPWRERSRAVAA